jgi:hypothetical protein
MSERAAYWQRLLADWERSGLSQAEFCRRRRVKAVTFAWWKRRLQGSAGAGRNRQKRRRRSVKGAAFVEVALPRGPASASDRSSASTLHSSAVHPMALHAAAMLPAVDGYELVLPGGACLRLPADFDPERVARFVQAVAATGVGGHLADSGGFSAC